MPALARTTQLGFNRYPDPHPVIRANTSQTSKTSRSRIRKPTNFAINRLADTPPLAPLRPNPHSARATAIHSPSRFRPMEAFGRRPPEPVPPPSAAGIRNPQQQRTPAAQHYTIPCHHALAEVLRVSIDAAGIAENRKGFLFRTSRGHTATKLSEQPMTQPDAWRMIRWRATAADITRRLAIIVFGRLRLLLTCPMVAPWSTHRPWRRKPRTTKPYDRTKERLT
jgi:hypothetical protein